jgi:iron complex transport system ATP-binding protein
MKTLRAAGLSVGYPDRTLCRDLDLELESGQCWALLGNNGSGKSTLLHVLAGLRAPLRGGVQWAGIDLASLTHAVRAGAIGLLLQEEADGFWGSVREYVLLGRYPHRSWRPGWSSTDEAQADAAIQRMDLCGREWRALNRCSGGERQRARLAALLAQDPHVYLLDEPLLHLDLRHQFELLAELRRLAHEHGRTVVMVLHDPARARRFCDRALLLFDDGSTMHGRCADLIQREVLERLYGCPVEEPAAGSG